MEHRFTARIKRSGDMDAAYVVVPIDIRKEYGKGRLKVEATFDGEPNSGSVVNMGVKDADGNICYIIGITKACFMMLLPVKKYNFSIYLL